MSPKRYEFQKFPQNKIEIEIQININKIKANKILNNKKNQKFNPCLNKKFKAINFNKIKLIFLKIT